MSRIMLTRNKKNYASIVKAQEGNLVPEHKQFDMKGLAIKKVNTNRKVREVLSGVLENYILKDKNINVAKIIKAYKGLEHEIYESLKAGKLEFAIPGKVNSAETYAAPFTIESFRGTTLWNRLFPDNIINAPAKVNMMKLSITLDDVVNNFDENSHYGRVFRQAFEEGDLLIKDKITTIAVPLDVHELPEFLRPFVNIEDQVNANIKSGIVLLESIGVQTIPVLNSEFPSTRVMF